MGVVARPGAVAHLGARGDVLPGGAVALIVTDFGPRGRPQKMLGCIIVLDGRGRPSTLRNYFDCDRKLERSAIRQCRHTPPGARHHAPPQRTTSATTKSPALTRRTGQFQLGNLTGRKDRLTERRIALDLLGIETGEPMDKRGQGWIYALVALVALASLTVAGFAYFRPIESASVSGVVAEAYKAGSTVAPLTTASAAPAPTLGPLVVQPGTKAVFFGDSWTAGYGAEVPKEGGFAYVAAKALQVDATFYQGGGTGYVNPGKEGKGAYLERFKKLPLDPDVKLLVMQGGLNDENKELGNLVPTIRDTFTEAKAKFPNAQVVVMGPLVPVRIPGLDIQIIDNTLHDLSRQAGFYYVSPQAEVWLDAVTIQKYIDPAKENHPNTAGHKYVTERLLAAIKKFA
jgi:acyl-CoA thioesterase-1